MSLKEQAHRNDKATIKQPSTNTEPPNSKILGRQAQPVTLIQQSKLDPKPLHPRDLLQLQRIVGNRAVGTLLVGAQQSQVLQQQLIADPVDGKSEQETNEVENQVVGQIDASVAEQSGQAQTIQDQTKEEEAEKLAQMKPISQHQTPKNLIPQGKGQIVQTFRAGLVPTAAWRNNNVETDYTPVRVLGPHLDARNDFDLGDKGRVLTRNNALMGAAPALPALATNHQSDESNTALLSPANASQVSPEVDHIVPVASQGSNDILNGRILSKQENTAPGTTRPNQAAGEIRAIWYEDTEPAFNATQGHPITRGTIQALNHFGYNIQSANYPYSAAGPGGEATGNLQNLVNTIRLMQD